MNQIFYTITCYNDTGGHTVDSGTVQVETQRDVNRVIRVLRLTESRSGGSLEFDLLGPFTTLKLPQ